MTKSLDKTQKETFKLHYGGENYLYFYPFLRHTGWMLPRTVPHMVNYWNKFYFSWTNDHYLENCFQGEVDGTKIKVFPILGLFIQQLDIFSKSNQNEPKGSYFGLIWSNKHKIIFCYVEMVDFCEKEQTFIISATILDVFWISKGKKWHFPCPKSWKRPIFNFPLQWFKEKLYQILRRTTRGLFAMGNGPKSQMCKFLTYPHFWEGSFTSDDF